MTGLKIIMWCDILEMIILNGYTQVTEDNTWKDAMEHKQFVQYLLENKRSGMMQRSKQGKEKLQMFEGTPKKHPVDNNLLVLLVNPFERNKKYYEFMLESIADIEELDTISSDTGENASRVRIWVYKGAVAFKTEPFVV